jgi:hypothetical protein
MMLSRLRGASTLVLLSAERTFVAAIHLTS